MPTDMNVGIPDDDKLLGYLTMARKLGFTGLVFQEEGDTPLVRMESGMNLFRRLTLKGRRLQDLKKEVKQNRERVVVISAPLRGVDTANWAVEDTRVDLLTVENASEGPSLRDTTARLASKTGTALEIVITPLLNSSGLMRSKIIKNYKEIISVAMDSGMSVILSSGATDAIKMRAPRALCYIGLLLGMNWVMAKKAVYETPDFILTRNLKRLSPDYVAPGIELVRRSDER
ncbi:MAG: RNase P subunit p30 family protein [Candidatus Hodarchaeota archaeon]